jgi:hypothetical protein
MTTPATTCIESLVKAEACSMNIFSLYQDAIPPATTCHSW